MTNQAFLQGYLNLIYVVIVCKGSFRLTIGRWRYVAVFGSQPMTNTLFQRTMPCCDWLRAKNANAPTLSLKEPLGCICAQQKSIAFQLINHCFNYLHTPIYDKLNGQQINIYFDIIYDYQAVYYLICRHSNSSLNSYQPGI